MNGWKLLLLIFAFLCLGLSFVPGVDRETSDHWTTRAYVLFAGFWVVGALE